jgi:hypothetical protein
MCNWIPSDKHYALAATLQLRNFYKALIDRD